MTLPARQAVLARHAERAISVLNRIVTDVRSSMSWGNIRMHLIGAEDVKAEGYLYFKVARAWQGMEKRRRTKRKERKASEEKDERKRKGRAKILLDEGEDVLSGVTNFGSDSGSPVSSLSSIANSDRSSGGRRSSGSDSGGSGSSSSSCGSSSDSDSDRDSDSDSDSDGDSGSD